MSNEITEEDKKMMAAIIGKELNTQFIKMMEDFKIKAKLVDARHELTQKKLDVLDEKMERLLNYPQKNKITLDKILEIVESLQK